MSVQQEELYLTFYGDDLTYRYTVALTQDEQQRRALDEIISGAEGYWQSLPKAERNFDRAKTLYMRIHP